jgi:hypothetical protein
MRRTQRLFPIVLAICAALALIVGPSAPAGAKKKKPKNPLAGKWVGATAFKPGVDYPGPYAPLSYRITRAGQVLDFSTSVTTYKTPSGGTCPSPILATVLMPPATLSEPVPGFPKGKRFSFVGMSNGSPPARLFGNGAVAPPYSKARNMTGLFVLGQGGPVEVSPGVLCRTGTVYWTAHRVGGK